MRAAWLLLSLLAGAPDGGTRAPPLQDGLPKSAILKVVLAGTPDVRACYEEKALAVDPSAHGTIAVTFTIGPGGTVVDATLETDDFHQPEMTACVLGVVRAWRFPRPQGREDVEVTFPWVFSVPDAGQGS